LQGIVYTIVSTLFKWSNVKKVERTDESHSSFYGENGLRSLEIVLVDLFIGGSETTATSINWTILYLLHYPHVQDKIHEELDLIVGKSRLVKKSILIGDYSYETFALFVFF
jgi:hypothetical protein